MEKKLSNETKQKLTKAKIGNKNSLGYKHPKEFSEKLSNARIGNKLSTNTSGYLGVTWSKWGNKWMSRFTVGGKPKHLGYFTDLIQAAKAYDTASWEAYGRLDILNFPEDYTHLYAVNT